MSRKHPICRSEQLSALGQREKGIDRMRTCGLGLDTNRNIERLV